MKSFTLILFLFFGLTTLFAQTKPKNVPFEKEFFPDQRSELRDAIQNIKEGNTLLEMEENYDAALEFFELAYKFNPNNAELNFLVGYCYLHALNRERRKSLSYLQKSLALDPEYDPMHIHLILAQSYQINYQWEKAIEQYRHHQKINHTAGESKAASKGIEECLVGIELVKKPTRCFIDNLGKFVNSEYPEYAVVINADETEMLFTARRPDTQGGTFERGQYLEDVYQSLKKGGNWMPAVNLGDKVNSKKNDATVGLLPDGLQMLVYIEGDLYESEWKKGQWTSPSKFSNKVNTKFHETSACFSPDAQTLYFVSDKPEDSMGGYDIYVTKKNAKGEWGDAVNIGAPINTEYNEEGVFIHPDGKTMYFSSNGHNNMGGFDIFKSVYENGKWSTPENMGYPISTPEDDVFFVVNARGNRGYYSANKEGGFGLQDLYVITMLGAEKYVMLNTEDNLLSSGETFIEKIIEPEVTITRSQLTLFKGTILDSISKKPVASQMVVKDIMKDEVVNIINTDDITGKFMIPLPSGRDYGISIKHSDYLYHSENFNIPVGGDFQEIEKTVLLKKIQIGSKTILKNIFFDTAEATLRSESISELNELLAFLNENNTLKVEISGHTDSAASDDYNLRLSDRRAKAVVDFLVAKGISKDRMVAKGYGETQPIATNETEEGKQLNRRTEMRIIGK
jgi:outer membrane protein OmpA-like peptidoglycan-associated protein/tetratricopeptide (TPR) repeat protein